MFRVIYEAWHKEQTSTALQKINDSFYPDSVSYLHRLKEELEVPGIESPRKQILNEEFVQAESMLEELRKMRLEKISRAATGITPLRREDLSKGELRLYDALRENIETYWRQTQKPAEPPETGRKILVRFLQEVPEFVGVDLNSYGPFRAEDVSAIPIENATQLIKKNYAMEIEESTKQ
jgi:DNA replication factor GINS